MIYAVTCDVQLLWDGGNRQAGAENEGTCRHGKYVANNCASTRIDEYSSHTGENCMNRVCLSRERGIHKTFRTNNTQRAPYIFPKKLEGTAMM